MKLAIKNLFREIGGCRTVQGGGKG